MKTLSANLQTHVEGGLLTLSRCIMIERTDGTRLGFTDNAVDLTVDMGLGDGPETFTGVGGFNSSAHASEVGLAADTLSFLGVQDGTRITETDLLGGRYAGAQVWVFDVNRQAIADGLIKIDYGQIAPVTINDQTWNAQALSISALLGQTNGGKYGRYCRVRLGSALCGVELLPDVRENSQSYSVGEWIRLGTYDARRYQCITAGTTAASQPSYNTTIGADTTDGTATFKCYEALTKEGDVTASTSSRQVFTDSNRSEAANWFRAGVLTWTSGANSGLAQQVKSNSAGGEFTLLHPMPFAIENGDDYAVETGCNHLMKLPGDSWGTAYTGDCVDKYANGVNFIGEPDQPGGDEVLRGP